MEHTATPWKFYKDKLRPQLSDRVVMEVQDSCQRAIVPWTGFDCANQPWAEKEANARFIVLACNNFDEMRETLKELHIGLKIRLAQEAASWGANADKTTEFLSKHPTLNKLEALLAKLEAE